MNYFDPVDWSHSQGAFIDVSFDRELCFSVSRGSAYVWATTYFEGIRSDQTVLGRLQSISQEEYNQRKHWQNVQTRKQSLPFPRSISDIFINLFRYFQHNYEQYTEIEAHAELCSAEALLLKAQLTFIEDETLTSLIKGGIKIRSCFNSYK